MATRTIDGPSCSTPPSRRRCTYHVFLSFRGEDTRKSFTDFLYEALVRAGFHTFRDCNDIRRGKPIEAEIRRGIMESKLSIIVFSKGYASSEWCLDELVMIMERQRIGGYVVLPIFYDVDPDQVSGQTLCYEKAFDRHQEKFEEYRVESWRKALRDVAELAGVVLGERHQASFIQDVVKEARKELDYKTLHIPKLFGVESNIERLNSWLIHGPDYIRMVIIYGIGGVGKTTIASTIYNQNFDKFEGSSFLAKVKDTSEQPNGLIYLQKQLISDILNEETKEIYNVDQGMLKIKNVLCCKQVLIVIDDVDELEQFNAIIGMLDWLYKGSKVIVTTRTQNFLECQERVLKLKLKPLDDHKALQLFSWHCFGQVYPIDGYEEDSKIVVQRCGGLPLALKVLGSSLACNDDLWKIALQEPEVMDYDGKIQKILRISYESLQDDRDKGLFLDISCFFIEKNRCIIDKIVECHEFYRSIGLQRLVDHCLITIDENNILTMHKLMRDMGREIVRQESYDDLAKRSRLWRHKDVIAVLEDNIGTAEIRGLALTMHSSVQRNQTNSGGVKMRTEALSKMVNLKFLQLDYVKPTSGFHNFPKSIVWLCWHGFPFKSVPRFFCLKKLVVLDMRYSNLINVWDGKKCLPHLKILDLSYSRNLVRTPDFSEVPLLERLMLEDCISLVEVHKSIYNLKSLKEFIFSGSSRFDELSMKPLSKGSWWSVALHSACIRRSPDTIGFSLSAMPSSLAQLSLSNCNITDGCIPDNLSCLPSLKKLDLSGNPIQNLPESIINLTMLEELKLANCEMLRSLPELPDDLDVYAFGCISLERVSNIPSGCFGFLACDKLVEVEAWMKQKLMGELDVEMMEVMEVVDAMANASQTPLIMIYFREDALGFFLDGVEMPSWLDHEVESFSISVTVPPLPLDHKFCALIICVTFSWKLPKIFHFFATVSNQTKRIDNPHAMVYIQTWEIVDYRKEKALWLVHLKNRKHWESGDQLKVSVHVEDEGVEVERCGIYFHYTKDEDGEEKEEEVTQKGCILPQSHVLTYPHVLQNYRCFNRAGRRGISHYNFIRQGHYIA